MSGNSSLPSHVESLRTAPLAAYLKVLAEPKRLLILDLLMQGVQCNCELGDALQMPPNLISHHLNILRQAGLVDVERDALDARWIYYSINRAALDRLHTAFGAFFDPARIQPRHPNCGPQAAVAPSALVRVGDIGVACPREVSAQEVKRG
ncbi:MAG: ArsR family transcriptional regulator [Chloroflexi bacterium]|nr:ArsR family transcriptional regulator [Chloroflexota bacterium]